MNRTALGNEMLREQKLYQVLPKAPYTTIAPQDDLAMARGEIVACFPPHLQSPEEIRVYCVSPFLAPVAAH